MFPFPSSHFRIPVVPLALAAGLLLLMAIGLGQEERLVLFRTLALGTGASLVAIPLGILISWVCLHRGFWSRSLLVANMALVLLPILIQVSGWDAAFGKLGWLTAVEGQVLKPLISGWSAAIWIHGLAAAPQVALLLLVAHSVSSDIYEEPAILETTSWQVFLRITLPRMWPLLLMAALWIHVSCAREIAVTDLYQIGTLAEQIYLGYSLDTGSVLGNWSAEQLTDARNIKSWLTMATLALLAMLALAFSLSLTTSEESWERRAVTKQRPASWSSGLLAFVLLAVLVIAPLSNVVIRACFYVQRIDGQPEQRYSVEQLFHSIARATTDYADEFVWSMLIAVTAASAIVIGSFLLAIAARDSLFWKRTFAALLAITCAVPGPTIGGGLANLFAQIDWAPFNWLTDYTIFGPVLACILYCWPIGGILLWFVVGSTPRSWFEAARLENAGWLRRAWHLGVQGNRLAIAGTWLVLAAICFGELPASQMVRPAGMDTVPRKMLGDLHAGVNELTAGITIVVAAAIIAISLLGWIFIWLNHRRWTAK